ncbi:MAG: threonylcarbamoyl-AMP synthase [Ruminococcaceae bacterium]|nr:threonylcarbamoyl-AMP synthase [Oscillospiraceae bacterium]
MKTEYYLLSECEDNVFERAGQIIREGGLVAFPTETVYGLGGDAYDPTAAERIFAAKGRPSDNPLIVHVARPSDAESFAVTNDTYYKLAEHFMPGPLTVILEKKDNIPKSVTGGLDTVAVRCPSNVYARRLIEAAGVPIAAPSANISGKPSPTNGRHVYEDMEGKIAMILDGGDCAIGVESTVIRLEEDGCTILRPGEVIARELARVVGNVYVAEAVTDPAAAGENPQSPGMKYRHYAPKAKLVLVDGTDEEFAGFINEYSGRCAVLSYSENLGDYKNALVLDAGSRESAHEQMKKLFSVLRSCDEIDCEIIFAHLPPKTDDFLALYNRIIRAAGSEVIYLAK